jgi:hypothetical protein
MAWESRGEQLDNVVCEDNHRPRPRTVRDIAHEQDRWLATYFQPVYPVKRVMFALASCFHNLSDNAGLMQGASTMDGGTFDFTETHAQNEI